jgi:hypothetical protein
MSMSNAELVEALMQRWAEWEREGIGPDDDSIMDAAAVGMVIEVWRNSPVEDMHASRRGPTDAEMFAESVALHRVAKAALDSGGHYAIFDFEHHVLDRQRPWAGGGRTLQQMGYGHLGELTKHVKERSDALVSLDRNYGRRALLAYLVSKAVLFGPHHRGMPTWPRIVSNICDMVANPDEARWRGEGAVSLAAAPAGLPSLPLLRQKLLERPDELPLPVLDWLIHSGIMMFALPSEAEA